MGLQPTLSGSLPGEDDDAVDVCGPAQVDHPDGVVDVVVVHDGAVGQVGVGVTVDGERGVTVAPLLPRVLLVVRPRVLAEGLVRHCKHIIQKFDQGASMSVSFDDVLGRNSFYSDRRIELQPSKDVFSNKNQQYNQDFTPPSPQHDRYHNGSLVRIIITP